MTRSEEIGQLAVQLETVRSAAKRLGLDVAAYLLALATTEVREAYVMRHDEIVAARSTSRARRRKSPAADR
jgi:hypothetical protein